MPAANEARDWMGWRVDDVYGARVGKLEDIYEDEAGNAVWALVRTARFNDQFVIVPLTDAVSGQGHVWIPHERALLRSGHFGMGPDERRVRTFFGVSAGERV